MSAPTVRRRAARSLAAEAAFRARVEQLGGRVVGEWQTTLSPTECICAAGHTCNPRPNGVIWGQGICRTCVGLDPAVADMAFRDRVAELGGVVVGEYINVMTPVACRCRLGHDCSPTPNSLQRGQGLCRACAGKSPAAAEAKFRRQVAELNGQVIGEYAGNKAPVACICPAGHPCRPTPENLRDGGGMCRICSGTDRAVAAAAFRARVAYLGGRVIGQYLGNKAPIACICPDGHPCQPRPNDLQQGHNMCRACVGLDPVTAEAAFRARVARLGGKVIGHYQGAHISVDCLCAAGHVCRPRPSSLRIGQGMCATCAGGTWDVLYVVASTTLGRVKFGITSGDERARLADHRRASYTDVVRVMSGLVDAHALERHIRTTLRDADIAPVQGREYFHIDALAVVLDVVDGWMAA
jgi:hypothetical protein